jgi:hypothetical protein
MNKKKSLNPPGRKRVRRFLIRQAVQNNILRQIIIHKIQNTMKRKLFSKDWINKFTDIHIKNLETRGETVKKASPLVCR